MPFPDELARGLAVVAYDRRWPGDFAVLARRIEGALGALAVRVDHVGSTSVPGLAAKDCIDVQVEVRSLDEELIAGCFGRIGFRLRPEPWNHAEATSGGLCPKLVFAPPEGERASNIHVLETASQAVRRKLLFRDFLRAHDAARDAWSDFKQRLVLMAPSIYQYGQAKAGPTEILMIIRPARSRAMRDVRSGLLRTDGTVREAGFAGPAVSLRTADCSEVHRPLRDVRAPRSWAPCHTGDLH